MDDLVQFLRARLDEDEQTARAATPGPWAVDGGSVYVGRPINEVVDYSESAAHIARHDPARVLAEVDAKRQMLDIHAAMDSKGERITGCTTCSWRDYMDDLWVSWPCPTLRLMLIPYADHSDYRAEWAIQPPDPGGD
ncbi:DUF6221 family protein [Streptomyces sp. NBC_01565]|uniref:DUF6221 family protein n=1 Tax=Streptomyces sp. NBC_01565 TaxID=2975881 RepID=UPI00225AA145|nr:DUF6221 family protein [Streptomyces sp. NBC_01565]MCX4540485.1 DUF6221 family protein [Streptomyces sp. NBC_01565]